MNQTMAVATQNGFPPRDGTLRRLTVHADSVRADLVLPASAPLESLVPAIVDIIAGNRGYQAEPVAIRHRLSLPGNTALDPSKTLAEIGIRDGAALILTSPSTELPVPRLDDAAEAVSQSLAGTERRWTPFASRLVAVLAAGWLTVVCTPMLIRTGIDLEEIRGEGVAIAATTGLVSLLAAGAAYRVFREKSAGLLLGLVACWFAMVAGALIVPGGLGAPNALFAAAASAAAAAVMRAIGCHTVVFTTLTCFAATGATVALVGAATTIPLHVLGAASAAISLILIEISAPISIRLASLSPQPSPDSDEPMLNPDCVKIRAIDARTWLTSLVTAFAASTALGAIGAAVGPHPPGSQRLPGIAFAALTGAVLLSRTRAHGNLAMSLPLIIFGTITVSVALVGAEAAYPTQSAYIATVSIGLAAAALRLGFVDPSTKLSPVGQRGIELLEYLALAAVIPLACWMCGLYAAARALNLP
jgi:type VII secretion integral membrane protein EccD